MLGLKLASRQFRKQRLAPCRLRARSVLHCHGVLVLRQRPWARGGRGVPDESHLQDAASNLEAGSAERQVLYTLPSPLCTLHSTLHTVRSTLYTPHSTLHTLHSTLYTLRFKLHTLHSTLHTLNFTLHTVHFTL